VAPPGQEGQRPDQEQEPLRHVQTGLVVVMNIGDHGQAHLEDEYDAGQQEIARGDPSPRTRSPQGPPAGRRPGALVDASHVPNVPTSPGRTHPLVVVSRLRVPT
jgi:hypothetical protein